MIKSKFAILDVLGPDRHDLLKRVEDGDEIPVVIRGVISSQYGNDDGVSIEFSVEVESVEVGTHDA